MMKAEGKKVKEPVMSVMASKTYVDRRITELKKMLPIENAEDDEQLGPFLIRGVRFVDHPVLGNLTLDFCDRNGVPVDTVILAGENGTGKSTVLNALNFALASVGRRNDVPDMELEVQSESGVFFLKFGGENRRPFPVCFDREHHLLNHVTLVRQPCHTIYSDVGIDFQGESVRSVTSLDFDAPTVSLRSDSRIATKIKQLMVDIQSLDDAATALAVRKARGKNVSVDDLQISLRMERLTSAFDSMFDGLQYDRIINQDDHKQILFKNHGKDVSIDDLSSGEKQIVYRGCFVLQNINAMSGAFVFIDEPELSMHPEWQKKILDFYKRMFINERGVQTSQIFVSTHSPFVIHNEARSNDKVLVLQRDHDGKIKASDRPEYYRCESLIAVKDAFAVNDFEEAQSFVYLEGRTDEKYLNKALEVFNVAAPFQFKWVGHIGASGQEENSGAGNLNKAYQFLVGKNQGFKQVCLFDCDTSRVECECNGVYTRVFPVYANAKRMRKGIENALILDDVDVSQFQRQKIKEGDYGVDTAIGEFDKMACCDYVCSLPHDDLLRIFANLKTMIDSLLELWGVDGRTSVSE